MAELGEGWGCFSLGEPKKNLPNECPRGWGCLGGAAGYARLAWV